MPLRCARRLTGFNRLGRAVLLCVVLSGLFLMHGAAPSAGGCHGGVPATTAMTMPMVSTAATGSTATGGAHGMPTLTSAGTAVAPASQAGKATPAVSLAAAGLASAASGGGMLCSSLPPRDAIATACKVFLAGAAGFMAMPVLAGLAAVSRRACRPPGPPGLPLPLFLGVSRT